MFIIGTQLVPGSTDAICAGTVPHGGATEKIGVFDGIEAVAK